MAGKSHLDELIDYKEKVIDLLGQSKAIVGLILDNPNIDMESDAAYAVFDNNLFNYDYVDSTVQIAEPYIMVETRSESTSPTMKDVYLLIQIVCPKLKMKLDGKIFKGVKGNRCDNLVRQIDLLLNNSKGFGIGRLELLDVDPASVPSKYSSKLITYKVPDFARDRSLGNV